jgi:predicted DCC family thiol-disulfide oxidoreductase YuxK
MISTEMARAILQGGERGTTSLTVLFDRRCSLCRRLKEWLGEQPTLVPIAFVAADTHEAHELFPDLDHRRTTSVLTVVDSNGAVYEGERAWLACGWALPAWQPVAENFSSGVRLRIVRVAARVVDGYRHLGLRPNEACERCAVAAP